MTDKKFAVVVPDTDSVGKSMVYFKTESEADEYARNVMEEHLLSEHEEVYVVRIKTRYTYERPVHAEIVRRDYS